MEQPTLPGMPPPEPDALPDPPITQEHVEVKVYPPTPERDRWFVITTHRWPGGTTVRSSEHGAAYTPGYIGRVVTELLCESFLELEPF